MDHPSPVVLHEHDVEAESWDDAIRGTLTFRTLFGGPASRTGQFTAGVADLEPFAPTRRAAAGSRARASDRVAM